MLAETAQPGKPGQLPLADFIFGSTPAMQEVRRTLDAALEDDLPVLIEGESGTGKEVVARYLHLSSNRASGPFIRVNCGAMPARLLDGEMFGQGATGGHDRQGELAAGSMALAAEGTLFLDEIAEMDAALARKVTGVLREGTGAASRFNARLVCASSVDLERGSRGLASNFGYRVRLLPLRERKQDIPQLCEYLLEKLAREFGRTAPRLKAHVLDSFHEWKWPGNIRELENWMARIVIFGTEEAMGFEARTQVSGRRGESFTRHHAMRLNMSRIRRARRHA